MLHTGARTALRAVRQWATIASLALLATVAGCSRNGPTEPSSNGTGAPAAAPSIADQPQSQTIPSGATATLRVAGAGGGSLRYQWYVGASGTTTAPIADATADVYTTPALTSTTSYWVRVTGASGFADSVTATITVTPAAPTAVAPTITTHPLDQTVDAGRSSLLTVRASGTEPFSYQWFVGTSGVTSAPVDGATAATYTPQLTATTTFWVRVSNAAGSADSNAATVTVVTPAPSPVPAPPAPPAPPTPPAPAPPGTAPSIVSNPASQSIAAGQSATLTVVAGGSAPLAYQWYQGSSGSTSAPMAGATAATMTTPALASTTSYWVRVSNASGVADSATAVITVIPAQDPGTTAFEDQVLVLVNQRRAAGATCGGTAYPAVAPLAMNGSLRTAARNHSIDMAANSYFSHTSLDGRTFDVRIRNAGYAGSFPLGENIAAGQSTPASVVDAWMASTGHCQNIMSGSYRSIGVGYAFNAGSPYRHYWTQDFGGS